MSISWDKSTLNKSSSSSISLRVRRAFWGATVVCDIALTGPNWVNVLKQRAVRTAPVYASADYVLFSATAVKADAGSGAEVRELESPHFNCGQVCQLLLQPNHPDWER